MKRRNCIFLLALLITISFSAPPESLNAQDTKDAKPAAKKPANKKNPKAKKPRKPNPRMAPIEDVVGLPRVLLIGDSISIGYTLETREALKGKANVHRPPTNCGPTTKGVESINQWLGKKEWDVIHFNFGLHDLKYMGPKGENLKDPKDPKNHQQVSPEDYEKNLRTIVKRLKETKAKLIWRNTTPVPEGAKGRVFGDSAEYNKIAAEVMNENGIEIHDMFALVKPNMKEWMQPKGNVHFNKDGCQQLGDNVAEVILKALGS